MELKVGMYVRIDGRNANSIKYHSWFMIDKIRHISNEKSKYKYYIKEDIDGYCFAVSNKMIAKASFNIADVLEAGDIAYMLAYGIPVLKPISESDILEIKLGNFQVIRVATKEQFESMSYKVDND